MIHPSVNPLTQQPIDLHLVEWRGERGVESKADVRSEARREAQRVVAVVGAAAAEFDVSRVGVGREGSIGVGRHCLATEDLDGRHVLEGGAHRVAREALRVEDQQVPQKVVAERLRGGQATYCFHSFIHLFIHSFKWRIC